MSEDLKLRLKIYKLINEIFKRVVETDDMKILNDIYTTLNNI